MAEKLGEILVRTGSITVRQLDTALKSQLILGGHLGTSLIELGFIDEDTLGSVLSRMHGMPYAPPLAFANIEAHAIQAVPRMIAQTYEAIPIKMVKQSVHIALVNAGDFRVIDELSFSVGRRVIPWISPEVRIYQALETYYGVARRRRYITLSLHLDRAVERNKRGTANLVKVPETIAPIVASDSTAAVDGSEADHDVDSEYRRTWQEVAEEIEQRGSTDRPSTPSSDRIERGSTMPLSALADHYCCAESIDDLARAAIEFSVGRAERLLLMRVQAGRASVWHERGLGLTDETRRLLSFQVNSEPLLQLLSGEHHYFGPVPPREDVLFSYRKLGVDPPVELLLIPIRVNDLLVAIALADGGSQGRVREALEDLLTAFHGFGMSVGLLAMRRKIRAAMGADAQTAVA